MTLATLMGLCVLGCMAVVAAPLPSSDMIDPESSRARSIRRAEARLGATVFALALLSFGILAGLERGSTGLVVPLVAITAAGLMALHPWILVRLCIPLGLPRLAVSLSRLGGHPWVRDPEGGAVLSGVLAQLRRPVDPAMHAWLRGRLRRGPLRGAGLVAAGLLAADGGDRDTARALLASLDDLDPDLCPPLARRIALDWLVADAVRCGDWGRVLALTDDLPTLSRTLRLMVALARCHRGAAGSEPEPVPSPWRAWLLAPRRRHTFALVRGALARPDHERPLALEPVELANDPRLAANDGGPAPLEALALHMDALVDGDAPGAPARFARLGEAWDRALDDFGLRGHVRRRADSLRCTTSGEKVMAQLHRDVCEDLASLLVEAGVPPDAAGSSATIQRAARHMHERTLEDLRRVSELVDGPHPALVTVDHVVSQWLAWLKVRRRYEAVARVAGPPSASPTTPTALDLRREAYAIVELHLRQLMAWLWNDVGERGLANAISTWLLLEAERVHDDASAAYHRHNVALVI